MTDLHEVRRLAFRVQGDPVPKGRARTFMQGGRVISTTPPKTREFEADIALHAAMHSIQQGWPRAFAGLCEVRLTFVCARPQNRCRAKDPMGRMWRESGRGDLDNFVKSVIDAMQGAGVFRNDACVVRLVAEVVWAAKDEAPCVEVEVLTVGEKVEVAA